MKIESQIGPMVCARVKGIHKRFNRHAEMYEIIGEDWKLACTRLHAFLTIRDGKELCCQPISLRENDLIWIDQHAFVIDGSLIKKP